ncbi:hypothetical protein Tco_0912624 [Tanacetum coccineum]
MHNNIMAAGSRDRPPMLATGRYAQWKSRFMRYVDTKPNGEALRKCILQGPYKLSNIIIPGQPAIDESPPVPERTIPETFSNITPENKAHYDAEKEEIHFLLTGIGDEIYSTVDACKTAHDMWIAIERFTSRDGELIESYYSRFYKMMNEMYQKEVNEIRAEKITKNANPLALVSAAQHLKRQGYVEKLGTHCKILQKDLQTYQQEPQNFFKLQKQGLDTTPRYMNENQNGQFGNQRTVTVTGAKETVGSQEKMLLCKQAKKGVPLQAEQADWLEDTDEEVDEQEREAHYGFMTKIQEVLPTDSGSDVEPLEKVDSNVIPDSSYMCDNDNQADQNAKECDDERVVLANLIANLKLDTGKNKKIQKQLKKANTSLAYELQECKSTLKKCKSSLEESNRTRDKYLGALHDKEVELEKYKTFKDHTIENDTLERKLRETLGVLA